MIAENEIPPGALPPGGNTDTDPSAEKLPESWKDSLACLVSSRIAIIQAESKDAAAIGAKKAALGITAALCALFTWILLLAGAVGAISSAGSWEWFHVAFAAAGIHFLIGFIAVMIAKAKGAPQFPITRAEFEKDRKWLDQLNKKPS